MFLHSLRVSISHSRTLLQATLALSLVVSSLKSVMLWLFHIFSSDAPIACPLFNLVRNSVVHAPSSVIRDPILYNGPGGRSPPPKNCFCLGLGPHLLHGSLGPPEPTPRTVSRLVQPFSTADGADQQTRRQTRSTQPCIPPGSLNRVPASVGVKAGMSRLPGGRQHCVILYGMWVPVAISVYFTLSSTLHL